MSQQRVSTVRLTCAGHWTTTALGRCDLERASSPRCSPASTHNEPCDSLGSTADSRSADSRVPVISSSLWSPLNPTRTARRYGGRHTIYSDELIDKRSKLKLPEVPYSSIRYGTRQPRNGGVSPLSPLPIIPPASSDSAAMPKAKAKRAASATAKVRATAKPVVLRRSKRLQEAAAKRKHKPRETADEDDDMGQAL